MMKKTRQGPTGDFETRRVRAQSANTQQPTIELVLRNGPPRSLAIRVGDWPNFMAGVLVRAKTAKWRREGKTDDNGEVEFANVPRINADSLQVELVLLDEK